MVSGSREEKEKFKNLIHLFSEENLTNMDTNIGSRAARGQFSLSKAKKHQLCSPSYLQSSFLNSDLAKDSGTFWADGPQLIFIEGKELCSI